MRDCNQCGINRCHRYIIGGCDSFQFLKPFKVPLLEIVLSNNPQTLAEILLRYGFIFEELPHKPFWRLRIKPERKSD